MTHLLDINVLIALVDPHHAHHETSHRWFAEAGRSDWATCSITESGFVRVLSNPAYPAAPSTPVAARERLAQFCGSGGHRFWPDDVSLRDSLDHDVLARLLGHQQVTDFHLAALASRHRGRLATLDGRLARSLAGTALGAAVLLVR